MRAIPAQSETCDSLLGQGGDQRLEFVPALQVRCPPMTGFERPGIGNGHPHAQHPPRSSSLAT